MAPVDSDRIIEAEKVARTDKKKAEQLYQTILSKTPSATNDAAVREYETALVKLGELYRDQRLDPILRHHNGRILTSVAK